jgi:hypothetical protein
MNDKILQEAYARVRSRYTDSAWFALTPRAITDAIYREMREIDAERVESELTKDTGSLASAAA